MRIIFSNIFFIIMINIISRTDFLEITQFSNRNSVVALCLEGLIHDLNISIVE